MKNWLWAAAGAVCALMLGACGPVNPVIGTGESSVLVTNDLSRTISSLEVLAGAPEGFETILPTEDVESIEPGQTVQVNYEVGEAVYDPATVGSGQTDQTADQPIAEPTSEVGDAPNAVYLDSDGRRTSDDRQNDTGASATESENGEQELVDEVTGTDDATTGTDATETSTSDLDSMPIQGDAIRVVADGETIVFDGLDLPAYKQVSLRVTDDGVGYVDYVGTDEQSGSTKEAATTAAEQWKAAQDAARKQEEADAAAAATAVAAEDTTAANGTDPNAGYDEGYTNTDDQGEGYTNTDDQGEYEGYTNTDDQGGDEGYTYTDDQGYDYGDSGSDDGGSVNQDEGNCIDIPDSEIN